MKKIGISPDGRDIYQFWTWDDDYEIRQVLAWKNKNVEDTYWIPELGVTDTTNGGLFLNKLEAIQAAISTVEHIRDAAEENYRRRHARLKREK